MPATSLVCAPYRLVISTCYGELTVQELKSAGAGLRCHPKFHPGFRQLIDLSHIVKLHLHFRDLTNSSTPTILSPMTASALSSLPMTYPSA
jgi:hypothetical protein